MKKRLITVLLLITTVFAYATDKYAPAGNTLADALQWLAVQTACLGLYSNAEAGDYGDPDPTDNYRAPDIHEYLANQSGDQTKVDMFYGICFDYARAAYNEITRNQSHYANLGIKAWYMAACWKTNPSEIKLFDPVSRGQHTTSRL
jgi:hypothetical protein